MNDLLIFSVLLMACSSNAGELTQQIVRSEVLMSAAINTPMPKSRHHLGDTILQKEKQPARERQVIFVTFDREQAARSGFFGIFDVSSVPAEKQFQFPAKIMKIREGGDLEIKSYSKSRANGIETQQELRGVIPSGIVTANSKVVSSDKLSVLVLISRSKCSNN